MLKREESPVEPLYHTSKWKRTRNYIIERSAGKCERCGKLITGRFIVHHMTPATPQNFYDEEILQLLCIECHNTVTFVEGVKRDESEIYKIEDEPITDLIDFNK